MKKDLGLKMIFFVHKSIQLSKYRSLFDSLDCFLCSIVGSESRKKFWGLSSGKSKMTHKRSNVLIIPKKISSDLAALFMWIISKKPLWFFFLFHSDLKCPITFENWFWDLIFGSRSIMPNFYQQMLVFALKDHQRPQRPMKANKGQQSPKLQISLLLSSFNAKSSINVNMILK